MSDIQFIRNPSFEDIKNMMEQEEKEFQEWFLKWEKQQEDKLKKRKVRPYKNVKVTMENFDEVMAFCGVCKFGGNIMSNMEPKGKYPTKAVLRYLEKLSYKDWKEIVYLLMFIFIHSYGSGWVGQQRENRIEITFVTGGWSGNEEVLGTVMRIENFNALYNSRWESGGLYSFVFDKEAK